MKTLPRVWLDRQRLDCRVGEDDYDALFRALSPVQTEYWSYPGIAPCLDGRADFDDRAYNNDRRGGRDIVKGRFMGGTIGYVDRADLALFATLYRDDSPAMSPVEIEVLNCLRHEGPMSVQMMKEVTGLLVKALSPALQKLQAKCLVFEDQVDEQWDRSFYLFEQEFPDVDLTAMTRAQAAEQALLRWVGVCRFATLGGLQAFSRLGSRWLMELTRQLVDNGQLATVCFDGQEGFCLAAERAEIEAQQPTAVSGVWALNRNDFLVKMNEPLLKNTFDDNGQTLFYLLIDNVFAGAVKGQFKNGPFVLQDVMLLRPEDAARRDEILDAIYRVNDRQRSPLASFNGKPL